MRGRLLYWVQMAVAVFLGLLLLGFLAGMGLVMGFWARMNGWV